MSVRRVLVLLPLGRWYRWLPTDNIVFMAPEGSASGCPVCVSSGTFVLTPFDDKTLPPTAVSHGAKPAADSEAALSIRMRYWLQTMTATCTHDNPLRQV